MNKEIGLRIKELRKSMNMNKEQFAHMIGISGQYLGTVESGIHGLSLDTFILLCEKTHTSSDYILFGIKPITDEGLKSIFKFIDEKQINSAFDTLHAVARFIRDKGNPPQW